MRRVHYHRYILSQVLSLDDQEICLIFDSCGLVLWCGIGSEPGSEEEHFVIDNKENKEKA